MDGEYRSFIDFFPKFPREDENFALVDGAWVKSALVNKEHRKVKAAVLFSEYVEKDRCRRLAQVLQEAYSLKEVRVRCCCEAADPVAYIDDFFAELLEDYPVLGGYFAHQYAFEGDILRLTVTRSGAGVLEKIGVHKGAESYFKLKFGKEIAVRFAEADGGDVSVEEFARRMEAAMDRSAPAVRPPAPQVQFSAPGAVGGGAPGGPGVMAGQVLLGKKIKEEPVEIGSLRADSRRAVVCGVIDVPKLRQIKDEKTMLVFSAEDDSGVIPVKVFSDTHNRTLSETLRDGDRVLIAGAVGEDKFSGGIAIRASAICRAQRPMEADNAPVKRVELHAHTFASPLDAPVGAQALVERAAAWGHGAIAVTDHGSLHGLPEAARAGARYGVKVIGGMEAYFVNDHEAAVFGEDGQAFNGRFTVFDIETTGLSASSDRITEIGGVLVENGEIVAEFSQLVNPEMTISARITELTGITNDMVADAPKIAQAYAAFIEFAKDTVLVAHNANFDCGFMRAAASRLGEEFEFTYIDTVPLCRSVFPELKSVKLNLVADHIGLGGFNHHRACDDARVLAKIFLHLLEKFQDHKKIRDIALLNENLTANPAALRRFHITLLARDEKGMQALNRLCSKSYLDYYFRRPVVPKSLLIQVREHLLVGSGCSEGELFGMLAEGRGWGDIYRTAEFYDFFELQSLDVNMHLVDSGKLRDTQFLREIYHSILKMGKKFDKPVVVTGDVHFLHEEDSPARNVLINAKNMRDEGTQGPLFFRSTDRMLEDFAWLGEETAQRVVVENSRALADMCQAVRPLPEKALPFYRDADGQLREMLQGRGIDADGHAQELDYLARHALAPLVLSAAQIQAAVGGVFVGDLQRLKIALLLGLTDSYIPTPLAQEPLFAQLCLELSISELARAELQAKLDASFGRLHCPFAGKALVYTPETAKHAVLRYEDDAKHVLRETVENRIAATIAGSVRMLQAQDDVIYIVPEDRRVRQVLPLSGTREVYQTHYEGEEYDGRLLKVRICADKGQRMLRMLEEDTCVLARDVSPDADCRGLFDSAEGLSVQGVHTLQDGLAGCGGFDELTTLRLLWYKLQFPQAFYCAYFSVIDDPLFAVGLPGESVHALERRAGEDSGEAYTVAYEMLLRGLRFAPVDLLISHYRRFAPCGEREIALPLCTVEDFSQKDAQALISEREKGEFVSVDDLTGPSVLSRQGIAALKAAGLSGRAEDGAQMSLF